MNDDAHARRLVWLSVGGLLSEDHDAVPGAVVACEWKPTRPHSLRCLVNTPL